MRSTPTSHHPFSLYLSIYLSTYPYVSLLIYISTYIHPSISVIYSFFFPTWVTSINAWKALRHDRDRPSTAISVPHVTTSGAAAATAAKMCPAWHQALCCAVAPAPEAPGRPESHGKAKPKNGCYMVSIQ